MRPPDPGTAAAAQLEALRSRPHACRTCGSVPGAPSPFAKLCEANPGTSWQPVPR